MQEQGLKVITEETNKARHHERNLTSMMSIPPWVRRKLQDRLRDPLTPFGMTVLFNTLSNAGSLQKVGGALAPDNQTELEKNRGTEAA